jgi:hypothetical protein
MDKMDRKSEDPKDQFKHPRIVLEGYDGGSEGPGNGFSITGNFPAIFIDKNVCLPGITVSINVIMYSDQVSLATKVLHKHLVGDLPVVLVCTRTWTEDVMQARHMATLGYIKGHSLGASDVLLTSLNLQVEVVSRVNIISLLPLTLNNVALDILSFGRAEVVILPESQSSEREWNLAASRTSRQTVVESLGFWWECVEDFIKLREDPSRASLCPFSSQEKNSFKFLSDSLMGAVDVLDDNDDAPEESAMALALFMQRQAPLDYLMAYLEADSIARCIEVVIDFARENSGYLHDTIITLRDEDESDPELDGFFPPDDEFGSHSYN